MKNSTKNVNTASIMGEGDLKKVLLTLSIPSIIAMLINAIYNFADTFFVGMLHDTAAIGAVSVAFPIFMIITAIGQTFGSGATSYIARCLGKDNYEEASKTAATCFFTAIFVAILSTILCFIFLKKILVFSGASKTIMPYAMSYSIILILGSIFNITNMTLNNIIRAEGNSKFSMYSLVIGAVLNIVLDPIFILCFHMGVKGAALATVIGQIVTTIYLISYFKRGKSSISISQKYFTPCKRIYVEVFKIGIPTFCMQFLTSFAMGLLNSAAIGYGDSAIAAVGITVKINSIVAYILIGYIQGLQPVVGYNYGAKKYDRVHESIKISLIWTTAFCVLCTIILNCIPDVLMRLFTNDSNVIRIGVNNIKCFNLLTPILGFQMVYNGLFQALGKGTESALISVSRQGLFFIPAILILPSFFMKYANHLGYFINILPYSMNNGLCGLLYSQAVADLLTTILTLIFAIKLNKHLKLNN